MSCAGSQDPALILQREPEHTSQCKGQWRRRCSCAGTTGHFSVRHSDTKMQCTFFRLMRPVAYTSISNLIKMLVGLYFFSFLIQHKLGLGFALLYFGFF